MARLILAILVFVLTTATQAQNIVEYRYWWDDDLGAITNVPVTGSPMAELNTSIPTSALGVGVHRLTIQFRDDGDEWSAPYTTNFLQQLPLTQWEYWFDDNISGRVTLANAPSTSQNINASLDASALEPGYHRVSVRSLTQNNESSAPYTTTFVRTGGEIARWQYWFNDDVSTSVDQTLAPPADVLELITTIDASSLPVGPNTITWRSADQIDSWSVPITYAFDVLVGVEEIPGLQQLTVFPNPATDDLYLRYDLSNPVDMNVEVVDPQGRVLLTEQIMLSSGVNVQKLDVSGSSPGAYLLRIRSAGNSFTQQFLKQ